MLHWLFVDLNSYFASVEQQCRPQLRNRPIAVVPTAVETTCCIAASIEAKRFGVKTGVMVRQARQMCPGLELIVAQPRLYATYHEKLVTAVESCLPVTAVLSIDEMACRLSGRDQEPAAARALAMQVKERIRQVGDQLGCSIGLAPNRLLAKMASDMQKPDGLVLLDVADLPDKLLPLALRDIPGVGERMEKRLQRHGILTMAQLLALDSYGMQQVWGGVWGERFYHWLRGVDSHIEMQTHQSIGHSHVLPPNLRTPTGAWAVAQKLLQKAAVRLRKSQHWASGLSLSLRGMDQQRFHDDLRLIECQDTQTLMEGLTLLWQRCPASLTTPIKVAITLYDLIPDAEHNLSLWDNPKRLRLAQTLDQINQRFGRQTLFFAGTELAKNAAPTRIAFTSMPDFEA